jgi:hypothetical protein
MLVSALVAQAQGNSFNRVRYNGSTLSSKVSPQDWDHKLTMPADLITLQLKDGAKVEIPPKTVTPLSYGQEAHRRVGSMVALAILVAPVALFGLFHKTRLHFTGIQYSTSDNRKAGSLLQGDKDNYRAVIVALQSVSGVPMAVSEKDRQFSPLGTTTTVVREAEEPKPAAEGAAQATTAPNDTGTVAVTSVSDGADAYTDGAFVGNCPAFPKFGAGKHSVRVSVAADKVRSKHMTVQVCSEVRLNVILEKQ